MNLSQGLIDQNESGVFENRFNINGDINFITDDNPSTSRNSRVSNPYLIPNSTFVQVQTFALQGFTFRYFLKTFVFVGALTAILFWLFPSQN